MLKIFGLSSSKKFAKEVADYLDVELSEHVESNFQDKESYCRSIVNVRGCDVYVIQSLYTNNDETINDKFAKLLFFIGSLRDASASKVTVVIPYLGYSRQDRKTESRAPVTTKYLAMLFESLGINRLLTMDVHNLSAFQNSFRIPTDHLEAKNLLADYAVKQIAVNEYTNLVTLSPDSGAAGRTKRFRTSLSKKVGQEVGMAYLDKTRVGDEVKVSAVIGEVKNKNVIVVDDLISSGSTLVECKKAVEAAGGNLFMSCATHGLFVGNINEHIPYLGNIVITDTILPCRVNNDNMKNVHMISTSKIFAQAIKRIHDQGGSISELLK